jgi:hypothetical protein
MAQVNFSVELSTLGSM